MRKNTCAFSSYNLYLYTYKTIGSNKEEEFLLNSELNFLVYRLGQDK